MTFLELRHQVEDALKTSGYSKGTLKSTKCVFNHLQHYLEKGQNFELTHELASQFLLEKNGTLDWDALTKSQKGSVRCVEYLTTWLESKELRKSKKRRRKIPFEGKLGQSFEDFLLRESHTKHPATLKHHRMRLSHLYLYLYERNMVCMDITTEIIIGFLAHLDNIKTIAERDNHIISIRAFMKFLCERKELQDCSYERWINLLRLKRPVSKKIPSVYTQEEVERIIASIDRISTIGKRNYVMILLCARYGLRAIDVVGMRFCNIDWDTNEIRVRQQKTDKEITLPLSEEVGCALIDYIKNGRPSANTPYLFIKHSAPYGALSSGVMALNVSTYMRRAGIDSTGKRTGSHILRHSLASNLLKANEQLPVISEILGHKSTESTKSYLKVDLDRLRQCALDVPFVSSLFYDNLYGK